MGLSHRTQDALHTFPRTAYHPCSVKQFVGSRKDVTTSDGPSLQRNASCSTTGSLQANVIAGPMTPSIDECAKEEAPSCHSFVRENCNSTGSLVLNKNSITDAHACQDLLITVGQIYKAKYFLFDSDIQECDLYDTKDMNYAI